MTKCIENLYCTVGQKKKKTVNSKANNCRQMKLIPINTGYCLLQFDFLKFVLEVLLHGESLPNFIFFFYNENLIKKS